MLNTIFKFGKFYILALCLCVIVATFCEAKKNIVVPTYYGYGVVPNRGGTISPYVVTQPYGNYYYGNGYQAYYPYYSAYNPYYPYYACGYYPYYSNSAYYVQGGTSFWNAINLAYAQGSGAWFAASLGDLNLRAAPENGKNVIGSLAAGERVWVYAKSGKWYYVQSVSEPGKRGYAYADYFQIISTAAYPWSYIGTYAYGAPTWMAGYAPRAW